MKTRIVILLSLVVSITCTNLMADVWVQGYTRRDGTRVRGHYRSDPDGNFWNNWSTVGNTNPYTGKPGWKRSPSQGFGGFNSIAGFVHRAQVIAHQQQRVACAKRAAASRAHYRKLKQARVARYREIFKNSPKLGPEQVAVARLRLANQLLDRNDIEAYERWIKAIVREFPQTEVAQQLAIDHPALISTDESRTARMPQTDTNEKTPGENVPPALARGDLKNAPKAGPEQAAKAKLRLAKQLLNNGKAKAYQRWIKAIVREFPQTEVAHRLNTNHPTLISSIRNN